MVKESKGCFFCPENVFLKTPQFLKEIVPEGRICIGKAVGFPNLNPIGTYGNLVVPCREHFLNLNQFSPEIYEEGLSVSIEIIRRTMAFDPNAVTGRSTKIFFFLQAVRSSIPIFRSLGFHPYE